MELQARTDPTFRASPSRFRLPAPKPWSVCKLCQRLRLRQDRLSTQDGATFRSDAEGAPVAIWPVGGRRQMELKKQVQPRFMKPLRAYRVIATKV